MFEGKWLSFRNVYSCVFLVQVTLFLFLYLRYQLCLRRIVLADQGTCADHVGPSEDTSDRGQDG